MQEKILKINLSVSAVDLSAGKLYISYSGAHYCPFENRLHGEGMEVTIDLDQISIKLSKLRNSIKHQTSLRCVKLCFARIAEYLQVSWDSLGGS
jgi:hypothetical protein